MNITAPAQSFPTSAVSLVKLERAARYIEHQARNLDVGRARVAELEHDLSRARHRATADREMAQAVAEQGDLIIDGLAMAARRLQARLDDALDAGSI